MHLGKVILSVLSIRIPKFVTHQLSRRKITNHSSKATARITRYSPLPPLPRPDYHAQLPRPRATSQCHNTLSRPIATPPHRNHEAMRQCLVCPHHTYHSLIASHPALWHRSRYAVHRSFRTPFLARRLLGWHPKLFIRHQHLLMTKYRNLQIRYVKFITHMCAHP